MNAIADVGAWSARVCSRANSVFYRGPSRHRNRQTALCGTCTPRAASSPVRPWSVKCDIWLVRSTMKARCGSRACLRRSPILADRTEPVSYLAIAPNREVAAVFVKNEFNGAAFNAAVSATNGLIAKLALR
jgi:hypothetical protein